MKNLTLVQLKKWKPCDGWTNRFKKDFGNSAKMVEVEKILLKDKDFSSLSWLIGKRLDKLNKRKVCAFAYRCSHRALKYVRKQDLEALEKAINFAKVFAEKGKVDTEAARSAAWSAESAWSAWSAAKLAAWSAAWSARSAESAAWSAAWSAESAAWSAAWSAESAWSAAWSARSAESAESAWSAARSAKLAEYIWQLTQLTEIEKKLPKKL